MSDSIKPYYGNKIITSVFIVAEFIFFGFVLFSSFSKELLYSCLTLEIPKDEKFMQKIIFFFNEVNPVRFTIFVLIIVGFIVSITALCILMVNDDCNIRFAKLKELKDLSSEVKSFENKLNVETKVKETSEKLITNNSITKTTETTHTNFLYEFYKKYMDTLSEI